jgi:hypothetical protein
VLEVTAHLGEFLCRFQHQTRCRSGFAGIFRNALDIVSDFEGAGGGGLDAFRDALCGSALLLDRRRNRRGDAADALDRRGLAESYLGVIARSEATKQSNLPLLLHGLLRGACHRARIRATRWLAMTVSFASWLFEN